jgi:hypoxanthine phosphoribosyltransferase
MDEHHSIPLLFSEAEIAERLEELAEEISANIEAARKGDLVIVALLRGSFMFTSDLVRAMYRIGVQPQIDFMAMSSYKGMQSGGEVVVHREVVADIEGKTVLVLDDILESGRTLEKATEMLRAKGAAEIKVCVLLEKPGKLETPAKADFVGFRVPDKFVIGYGLDCDNHYRELPYIGYLDVH